MKSRQTIGWAAAVAAIAFAGTATAGPVGMGLHRTEEHSRAVAKARADAKVAVVEQKRVCVAANTPPHRPAYPAQTCFNR
jgi:ribosomal protein S5